MSFTNLILTFIVGFILTVILMPIFIPFLHRLKYGQPIREEGPKSHYVKAGTPTMAGAVFISTGIVATIIVNPGFISSPIFLTVALVTLSYALIGFIDDYIKVVKKHNQGLKARYKYLFQSIIAIAFYYVFSHYIGQDTTVLIPLFNIRIEMGHLYGILVYFMFVSSTNGVNLSDGLDGLAAGLMMIALFPYMLIAIINKQTEIAFISVAFIGALLGHLMFNIHPAKIIMGDVGALGLGGILASVALFTKQELLLILIGGVFVAEVGSYILQVISLKTRGKRLFRMTPLHHHFELLGWKETQVVLVFWIAGFVCAVLGFVVAVL